MGKKTKHKVFVIGLDGGTFDLILPWANAGKLPNFSRLLSSGVHGDLHSTIHPLSPQAWSSFITGKNPGKHGIYGFAKRNSQSYDLEFTNATNRDGDSLWHLINKAGGKVGVIDVPFTYPPEKVNGFIITGMDAMWESARFIYPEPLKTEIEAKLGDFYWYPQNLNMKEMDRYVKDIFRVIDHRAQLTQYLMENKEWDFFISVFLATDRVQHQFWRHMDKNHVLHNPREAERYGNVILQVYQKIDKIIGELIAKLDDNVTFIIISDHGSGPYKWVLNLSKWLNMNGLLQFKNNQAKAKLRGIPKHVIKHSWFFLKRWLPNNLKKKLTVLAPGLKHKWMSHVFFSGIDWQNTKAYAVENYGNIYINVKGREPLGIVNPGEEYEKLREEIMRKLGELRDPDSGEIILDKVYKREELYSGPYLKDAPDLIVLWKDFAYYTRQSVIEEEISLFEPPGKFGNRVIEHSACHRLNGILIMKGKQLLQGKVINANIMDLAPTILYLMGLPVPGDMDGKVLTEAFTTDYLKTHPVHYVKGGNVPSHKEKLAADHVSKEVEATRERLRDLGYID
jgi:predicted AlkP superfamily phosphohydrolase/phosphomutase